LLLDQLHIGLGQNDLQLLRGGNALESLDEAEMGNCFAIRSN
jgi:hypothetical protein